MLRLRDEDVVRLDIVMAIASIVKWPESLEKCVEYGSKDLIKLLRRTFVYLGSGGQILYSASFGERGNQRPTPPRRAGLQDEVIQHRDKGALIAVRPVIQQQPGFNLRLPIRGEAREVASEVRWYVVSGYAKMSLQRQLHHS